MWGKGQPARQQRQGRLLTSPGAFSTAGVLVLLLVVQQASAFLLPPPTGPLTPRGVGRSSQQRLSAATTAGGTFVPPAFVNGTEGGGASCPFHQQPPQGGGLDYEAAPHAPGPFRWPMVGNMLEAMLKYKGLHNFDAAMQKKYGPVVRAHILGKPWYIVSDPALARDVLVGRGVDGSDFQDRFIAAPILQLMGNRGIIFATGQEHATNRRLSQPAFHRTEILDIAAGVVASLAKTMAARFAKRAAEGKDGTAVVDLHDDMRCLTLEAVSQASFSLKLGLLEEDRGEGTVYTASVFTGANTGGAAASGAAEPTLSKRKKVLRVLQFTGKRVDHLVREGFRLLGGAIRFPVPFAYKIGLNPAYNQLERVQEELQAIEGSILEARRREREATRARGEPLPPSKDLLDVYLEAIEEEGASLTDESIFRNINDIFLAGSDTTATTTSAALYEILRRPEVKARVEAELAALDIDDPRQMNPTALPQRLPFLDHCIKETLRLYPVASSIARMAGRDTTLGGYKIPQGSVVSASIRNLQLDPTLWGPDVLEFRPERWATQMEGGLPKGVPPGSYMPFGAGKHICLGMRLALMEALMVSAVLLKTLKLSSVDPGKDLETYYPAALSFHGGACVRVEGRK